MPWKWKVDLECIAKECPYKDTRPPLPCITVLSSGERFFCPLLDVKSKHRK